MIPFEEEYKRGECRCPWCGKKDAITDMGNRDLLESGKIRIYMFCFTCDCAWIGHYKLIKVEE